MGHSEIGPGNRRQRRAGENLREFGHRRPTEQPSARNLKAKHSLASLYRDSHENPKAFALFRQILSDDPNDFLTHKSVLEFYLRGFAGWTDIEKSYDALKEAWRSNQGASLTGSIGTVLARVAAARIAEAQTPLTERQFQDRIEQVRAEFRAAIDRSVPTRAAAPHFYYGVFLYDVAGQPDEGIAEMETSLESLQASYIRHGSAGKALSPMILYRLAGCYHEQTEIRPAEALEFEAKIKKLISDSQWHLTGDAQKHLCR